MRLKRLELQGFKSFLDRTILSFEQGITGVVGPNGCGKSNIVDAILWVMGEQSAKHLRGESMSDVIFNGSDTRQPTSMAEVSLVLDKEGVSLPTAVMTADRGPEVAITRRLFRDGTSEYLINKSTCRLRDIHELFMDTGVGRRAYSIIEQGQIDRMVNVKPEDRRVIFEEVAGITKYRAKRKEAERKLEQTGQNLARLQDIVGELEKRMRSLKIQATRARKYKDIKIELETVDIYLLGRRLYSLKASLNELEAERESLATARAEVEAQHSKADAQLTELDVLRIDQEKKVEALDQRERELSLLLQKMENQIHLFEEQKKHIVQSRENLDKELQEIGEELEALSSEQSQFEVEKDGLDSSMESLAETIEQEQQKADEILSQKQAQEEQRQQRQQELGQVSEREITSRNQIDHIGERKTQLAETIAETTSRHATVIEGLASKQQQLTDVETKIEQCQSKSTQVEQDVSSSHSDCQSLSKELSELEKQTFEKREVFHERKSRHQSLVELQEKMEGYSPTAKEILGKLEGTGIDAIALAEVLYPEFEIEEHLEILLGEAMNTLVVPSEAEAKRVAELIREKDLERVGIVALSELTSGLHPSGDDIGLARLADKIKVKEGYEAVLNWRFHHVFLCPDLETLFEKRVHFPQCVFITQDAKAIAQADKVLTCGNLPSRSGIFERRREIETLSGSLAEIETEVQTLSEQRESKMQLLEQREQEHNDLKDRLSSLHIEHVAFQKEKEKVQIEIDRAEQDRDQWERDLVQFREQSTELEEQVAQLQTQLGELEQQKTTLNEQYEAAKERAEQLELDRQHQNKTLNEKQVERSKLEERQLSLETQIERVKSDVGHYEERKETISERIEKESQLLEETGEKQTQVQSEIEERRTECNAVAVDLSSARDGHNQTCTEIQDLRVAKEDLTKKRDAHVSQFQEVELRLTQEKSDYEHQGSIALERYQREAPPLAEGTPIDLEKLVLFQSQNKKLDWEALATQEKESLLDEHLTNLRKKVERYGEVNLTAIQEFEEVEERHKFLMEQKLDLDESIKILEEAIKRIDETTQTRFNETVEGVNEKFKEVFPILFGGGKAELRMTNPESILESGVDVMVQPPGKRLQSISLLSGGEKALTATSLILAIFARKPSPFCLLDEVDAPLDDANVSRFNTVIQHMAQKSQFIVITHNRRTMEMADALYGVTMQQAGISKMTSVSLN